MNIVIQHHHLWLWLWFFVGALAYIVKRAFYLIVGPNPVAHSISSFIRVAGVPLLFRLLVDSGIYWVCFSPEVLQTGLEFLGWRMAAGVVAVITQYAPVALFFGMAIDPMVDWAIPTVIGRIPFLKDFWPQMPGPLEPPCPPTALPTPPPLPPVPPNVPPAAKPPGV